MRKVKSDVVKRFDSVIKKGEKFIEEENSRERNEDVNSELFTEWQTQSATLLRSIFEDSHPYLVRFSETMPDQYAYSYRVPIGQGVLRAAREDCAKGFLWTLSERVRAEVIDDYLEMADSLLNDGYKDAAAVIAGSTLEEHLRKLSTKNALPSLGPTRNR